MKWFIVWLFLVVVFSVVWMLGWVVSVKIRLEMVVLVVLLLLIMIVCISEMILLKLSVGFVLFLMCVWIRLEIMFLVVVFWCCLIRLMMKFCML